MPEEEVAANAENSANERRLEEARLRLYQAGAAEADHRAYRELLHRSAEATVASEPDGEVQSSSSVPSRRGHRLGWVAALSAVAAAALIVAALPALHPADRTFRKPAPTASTLRFGLAEVSLRQRLAQYPSTVEPAWQGAALAAYRERAERFVMLTVPDQYLGKEQLLVVRCASSAVWWQAQMFSSTYGHQSLRAEGRCGQIGTAVVPAGIGAVSVKVGGESAFSAALLARR